MPSIKFYLRSNNDKSKSHVLYCRISHNNTTAEFSLREKIDPKHWNQSTQRCNSPSKAQRNFVNFTVENITYKVKAMFLEKDYRHATAKQIIKDAFCIGEKTDQTLVKLVGDYIDQCSGSTNTIRNHKIKLENLKKFQEFRNMTFVPGTFNNIEGNRFIEWFKNQNQTKNNDTAVRNVLFYKAAQQWAVNQGKIESFALSSFTAKKDKVKDPVYLTRGEFEKIFSTKLLNPYHDRIRDLFCFQCLTGLSYNDLWSWNLIQKNNGAFIEGKRNKNGQSFRVPVHQLAIDIILKYNGKLPVYDNVVYNRVLKFVAAECNIKKHLTTHVGRKTFATLQDGNGWSKESIALMLGHRSIRTTEQYYIGKSFERLERELEKISGNHSIKSL